MALLKKITNDLFIIVTLLHINKPQNVTDESNIFVKKKKKKKKKKKSSRVTKSDCSPRLKKTQNSWSNQ